MDSAFEYYGKICELDKHYCKKYRHHFTQHLRAQKDEAGIEEAKETAESLNCGTAKECIQVGAALWTAKKTIQAIPYYGAACNQDTPGACWNAGLFSPKNSAQARMWFMKGCELDQDKNNCFSVIMIDLEKNKVDAAKALFKTICATDEDQTCYAYASTRRKAFKQMLVSACKEEHPVSCNILVKLGLPH